MMRGHKEEHENNNSLNMSLFFVVPFLVCLFSANDYTRERSFATIVWLTKFSFVIVGCYVVMEKFSLLCVKGNNH